MFSCYFRKNVDCCTTLSRLTAANYWIVVLFFPVWINVEEFKIFEIICMSVYFLLLVGLANVCQLDQVVVINPFWIRQFDKFPVNFNENLLSLFLALRFLYQKFLSKARSVFQEVSSSNVKPASDQVVILITVKWRLFLVFFGEYFSPHTARLSQLIGLVLMRCGVTLC